MIQGRNVQPQKPSLNRPGTLRSTSTSSILLMRKTPQSPDFNPASTPLSPALSSGPDAPPNTSQTLSGMATPASESSAGQIMPNAAMTTILAGDAGKPFKILTDLLTARSPYFRELFSVSTKQRASLVSNPTTASIPEASEVTLAFPELNEFAFALFNRWIYGAKLAGPADFHSMQHYLGLYVLALRFQISKLENEVMEFTQAYYQSTKITPPYTLKYIYEQTRGPNRMREFLVMAAAQRSVVDGCLGDIMRELIGQGGELTMDFIDALIRVQADFHTKAYH